MRHRTILIVDDHGLIREGAALMLRQVSPEVKVLQAKNPADARGLLREQRPDLIFLDVMFAGQPTGLAFLEELKAGEEFDDIPVIVMSGNEMTRQQVESQLFERGAAGYVCKAAMDSADVFQAALLNIEIGAVFIHGTTSVGAAGPASPATAASLGLTEAQQRVLVRVVRGLPYKRIARELDIVEGTVREHVSALLRIFKVPTSKALIAAIADARIALDDPPKKSSAGGLPR